MKRTFLTMLTTGFALVFAVLAIAQTADPLPSWNDGNAKLSIIAFVAKVTKEGSPDYVPPAERIATFDNDGTLWAEMPMYFQLIFALDRVKALAPQHPEWKDNEPFASLLKGKRLSGISSLLKKAISQRSSTWRQSMTMATAFRKITGRQFFGIPRLQNKPMSRLSLIWASCTAVARA